MVPTERRTYIPTLKEAKPTAYTLYLIMFGFYFVERAETSYME